MVLDLGRFEQLRFDSGDCNKWKHSGSCLGRDVESITKEICYQQFIKNLAMTYLQLTIQVANQLMRYLFRPLLK